MSKKQIVIAIDGPSGSGKSTLGKMLARNLQYRYIDTGAMYRALAWLALEKKIDLKDEESVSKIAEDISIDFLYDSDENKIIVNGKDLTSAIRTEEIGLGASIVSLSSNVRNSMVLLQRKMGEGGGVVMDGRDIGTVVFPKADVKFFLTANEEARIKRRFSELLNSKNTTPSIEQVSVDMKERDLRDKTRNNAPLQQALDAYLLDSSQKGINEVFEEMLHYINNKRNS